jgi:hypothetical protein
MADPTLSLTFNDLCIRVAEYLGIAYYGATGDEAAQLPTDAHDLDLVKRLVNDGYRRFMADNPLGWNFLKALTSVTFGTAEIVTDDNSRYYLPDDFGGELLAPFTYAAGDGLAPIRQVDEATIRVLESGGDVSGNPEMFAILPLPVDETDNTQRWQVMFWPTPSGTQTVTAQYRRWPAMLSVSTHRSIAGPLHDGTVLAAALAAAEEQRADAKGVKEAAYQQNLQRSLALDVRTLKQARRQYGGSSEEVIGRRFSVDTYNSTEL